MTWTYLPLQNVFKIDHYILELALGSVNFNAMLL